VAGKPASAGPYRAATSAAAEAGPTRAV
jgi:hypothetical protein